MHEADRTLRERLLEMETLNATQLEIHRQHVQALLATKLSGAKRIGFAALALVGLATAISLGRPVLDPPSNWDEAVAALLYRLFAIFGFLVCIAWVVLTGWAAFSGVLRRSHRPWVVATTMTMGFNYLALLVFIFVLPIAHEESIALLGTQLMVMAFFLLNMIGLCAILGTLYRGQFKSEEKLLEIAYRLADLAEKIDHQAKS